MFPEILQFRSSTSMDNRWWRFRSNYGCFFVLGSRAKSWGVGEHTPCVDIQLQYTDFSSSVSFRWKQRKYGWNCSL